MTSVWTASTGSSLIATDSFTVTFDGDGLVIPAGTTKVYWIAPISGLLKGWFLSSDVSGSIVVDVWKAFGVQPTVANTITGSGKPTLTSGQFASDTSMTGWTRNFAAGDIFTFNIDSCTGITQAVLTLSY